MDELQKIRQKIDQLDKKIAVLLKKRLFYVKKIAGIKNSKGLYLIDKEREKEIMSKLETDFEKKIFKKILKESRNIQKQSLT